MHIAPVSLTGDCLGHPVDAITQQQAARILGCASRTVAQYTTQGRLTVHGTHP
jgi:hypothetical protein